MGIYRRGPGRTWHMSFVVNGNQIRRSTGTKDRKLAEKILAKVRTDIAEGKWFDSCPEREVTFRELMDRYMREHSRLKKRSWKRDENSLDHLLLFFGDVALAEVMPQLISQYKTERLMKGAKPATLNRELALAKHAYNLALKEWGWCRDNPFSKIKKEKENNARDRMLDYGEEKNLLDVCPKWLGNIVIFALDTGAREGEILELTWKDVDLFRRVAVIRQGKTGQVKTIPLTAKIFEMLKIKAKVRGLHQDLVFPSATGTRISDTNLGRAFRIALKKAGISDFRFHDLRHTFASRLAQEGEDIYLIQKLLGHRDPRMVQRYAHHSVESLRNGIEALDKRRQAEEKNLSQIYHNEASGDAAPGFWP